MADFSELQRNAILGSLPRGELSSLSRRLRVVDVEVRQPIYEPDKPITEVYFPLDSVLSLVGVADDKVIVEVATVGREGMVGLPVFLGAATSPHASFCQVGGAAVRMDASDLRPALSRDGALHQALNRFTQATMVQIAQNVVCNSTHDANQRAARWLLTTQDRVGRDDFQLTQEFLAQMLGVRRTTVTAVARRLQSEGLIRYRRGQMSIVDRDRLLKAACHCYSTVKAEFDALPGATERG